MRHLQYYFYIFTTCLLTLTFYTPSVSAESLIYEQDLVYEGAFRAPSTWLYSGYGYSGYALTYNPGNNSLFLTSQYQDKASEITIPAVVNSSTLSELNYSVPLQEWADPTEGNRVNIGVDGAPIAGGEVWIAGTLVYNNRLIGTTSNHYPGGDERLSHWDRSLDLSSTGTFRGNFLMDGGYHPNHKAGHMAHIPSAYQEILGGDILTGHTGTSAATSTSLGPSIWSFNGADLGAVDPIPANHLVGYPSGDRTLGEYVNDGPARPMWAPVDNTRGVVFPENSKTILFFGSHGTGPLCYKSSCLAYPEIYSVAPNGNEAAPYVYYAWAYNVDDLIAAKDGHIVTQEDYDANRFLTGEYPANTTLAVGQTVQPWNVVPYSHWEIELPIPPIGRSYIGGAGYDPTTQKIYLSQIRVDSDEPVIHVFSLDLEPTTGESTRHHFRWNFVTQ